LPEPWVKGRDGVRAYTADGGVLFSCPVCERLGYPVYFASEEDLQVHLRARICRERAMRLREQGLKPSKGDGK